MFAEMNPAGRRSLCQLPAAPLGSIPLAARRSPPAAVTAVRRAALSPLFS
ncbi:hypothetical protein EYF80_064355 [Liparis tanakae]|uniref:Uncharacterized protein n=1 Tax=Liparis tanakae TaxID=230148 RepID=A0A4Z2E9S4_9TELE|nr:hypothetical protein EYF80_064355 [Liparis tanakae]